jgi:hypothetical protein
VGFLSLVKSGMGIRHGRHEQAQLKLIGKDGNAFAILGRAVKAVREAGQEDEVDEFMDRATSGGYNHLLRVVMEWFEVDDSQT